MGPLEPRTKIIFKARVISESWERTSTISDNTNFLGPETRPLQKIRRAALTIGPHAGAHRVALRAATSIGVPLLILFMLDRMDLSIYASFGALVSLYGRFHYYGDRIRMQVGAGFIFLSSMLIGTLLAILDADITVRIMVLATVATFVTGIVGGYKWHPGGATFAVFAAGAVATMPGEWINLAQVLVVGSSAALFSIVLTATLGLLRTWSWSRVFRPLQPAVFNAQWSVAVTVGIGALLAGLIGRTFDADHWYWAMVAASVVLAGAATTSRLTRSIQRFIGTTLGVLIAGLLLWFEIPTLGVILAVIVFQALAELLIGRNYGVAMLAVTPLALLMVSLANPIAPEVLVVDRVFETFIGSLVGTIVALISAKLRAEQEQS